MSPDKLSTARMNNIIDSNELPKEKKSPVWSHIFRIYAPIAVVAMIIFAGGSLFVLNQNNSTNTQFSESQLRADGSIGNTVNALTQEAVDESKEAQSVDINTAAFNQTNQSVEQLGESVNESF